jgi:hypothetical protein
MMDVPAAGAAVVRDPLVIPLFIFAAAGGLTHILYRRHPVDRAIVRVCFLIALTIVLLHARVVPVPYQPLTLTGVPFRDAVHALLKIAWWLWAAWFLVGLLRTFAAAEYGPRESKLIRDLLAGLVYLAAIFAITLKALVPVVTYELIKDDLAPVIEARPEVSHGMCRALARLQAAGQLIASADIDKNVPPRRVVAWFSERLHRLFDLANAE